MILCCRAHTIAAGTVWVSALPVSIEDWGLFLRNGDYFNDAHWQHARRGADGADALLTRIGYRWPDRHRPVGSLTWHEAQAYAASRGGRLPWLEEWRALRAAFDRLGASDVCGLTAWLPESQRQRFGPGGLEWCGDPYNASAIGPDVRAERPLRRRITGRPACMVPDARHQELGLRVAFEKRVTVCRGDAPGWEWIDAAAPIARAPRWSASGSGQPSCQAGS